MKRSLLFSLATLILVSVTGCANFARKPALTTRGPLVVALAVTVNGSEQPTPSQWAAIVASVRPALEAAGYVFATNLATADRILRIDFTPDPLAPETRGHAVALGWRTNPSAIARTSYTSSPSSFSYVNYGMGYNNSFYDYYNGGSQTWTRSSGDKPAPPTHTGPGHHLGRPEDCPPDHGSRSPGRYAGGGDRSGGSSNSGSSSPGSWWRGRSESGSSGSSRSESSHSSSSYSSSSDSGGSSSYSGGSSGSSSSSSGGGGFDSSSAGSTQIER